MAKLRKKAAKLLLPDTVEEETMELEDEGRVMPDRSKPIADPMAEAERGAAALRIKMDKLKAGDKPLRKKERLAEGIEVEYTPDEDEPTMPAEKKPKSLRQKMVRFMRGQ